VSIRRSRPLTGNAASFGSCVSPGPPVPSLLRHTTCELPPHAAWHGLARRAPLTSDDCREEFLGSCWVVVYKTQHSTVASQPPPSSPTCSPRERLLRRSGFVQEAADLRAAGRPAEALVRYASAMKDALAGEAGEDSKLTIQLGTGVCVCVRGH
jgi:hypothetical protein